ncbi:MAG: hypothetical protein M3N08_06340 [Pseudomonadota bacterium]|nr:hypothetical protein [Pseudomonadota bacterium]
MPLLDGAVSRTPNYMPAFAQGSTILNRVPEAQQATRSFVMAVTHDMPQWIDEFLEDKGKMVFGAAMPRTAASRKKLKQTLLTLAQREIFTRRALDEADAFCRRNMGIVLPAFGQDSPLAESVTVPTRGRNHQPDRIVLPYDSETGKPYIPAASGEKAFLPLLPADIDTLFRSYHIHGLALTRVQRTAHPSAKEYILTGLQVRGTSVPVRHPNRFREQGRRVQGFA